MISLTPQMKILVGIEPVDFRNGIDGLVGVCRRVLAAEPFSGTLFVFCNRRRTAIKAIVYDTQGFWIFQKRLSHGRFRWWPSGTDQPACCLAVHELQTLLWNGDPRGSRTAPAWRQLAVGKGGMRNPEKKCAGYLRSVSISDTVPRMQPPLRHRGRTVSAEDISFIRSLIAAHPTATRRRLSLALCQAWN